MSGISRYIDKITSQYRDKPKFIGWLSEILDVIDGTTEALEQMNDDFDVRQAVGVQLDNAGEIVGIDREIRGNFDSTDASEFDDETYRRLIMTKIVANQWDGRQGTISEVFDEALCGDLQIKYHDNQDMSIGVDLIGDYRPIDVELVLRGYIIPRPMGVQIKANMVTESDLAVVLQARSGLIGTVSRALMYQSDADVISLFGTISFTVDDGDLIAQFKTKQSKVGFELSNDMQISVTLDDSLTGITVYLDENGNMIAKSE